MTAVKTKVSETEIVAGIEGTFTVIEPLRRVRPAKINHCQSIECLARSPQA
jgi:hypothetical protein